MIKSGIINGRENGGGGRIFKLDLHNIIYLLKFLQLFCCYICIYNILAKRQINNWGSHVGLLRGYTSSIITGGGGISPLGRGTGTGGFTLGLALLSVFL